MVLIVSVISLTICLAEAIRIKLIVGGRPFCFHGSSLAVQFLSQLPTYLTPFPSGSISNIFPHRHYQQLPFSRNSPPLIRTHSTVPHFHLVASTKQIPSICFTPQPPFPFLSRHTLIQPKKITIIVTNLFSVDLTITFTKQCKANSRQPQI